MADSTPTDLGRRIRLFRVWKGLTQEKLAGLAGLKSKSYISRLETGTEQLNSRSTLEALANALEITTHELTGGALLKPGLAEDYPAVAALRLVLTDLEIGDDVDCRTPPEWADVQRRVEAMNKRRHRADYARQGENIPGLIYDLHACLTGPHRRDALIGLVYTYSAAGFTTKNLSAPDLNLVASNHVRKAAELLSEPEWTGLAAWTRAQAISGTARERAHQVAMRGADELAGNLDKPEVAEMYGSLHLTAALAACTLGNYDRANDHLAEASDVVKRPGVGSTNFGELWFSQGNIDIWNTTIQVEAGHGGRAVEQARSVDPASLPVAPIRQAAWWIDIGRGLALSLRTRDQAIPMFTKAERLAPQKARTNPFVREITEERFLRARANAGTKELRDFAQRCGIIPAA